ncbi:DUF4085 family protein [Sporosarcina limicola]|uniref:Knr4/Smi1-like domain-containing protein n=1 Tax=Sporosarcina limicola TaxID=34101 RepID=A0A927MQR6_9BACL|nr:DUF4085 family protein [Sporosarcina limicola]MBE1555641.1 hypothetical protein [Sporosarcina limicola]
MAFFTKGWYEQMQDAHVLTLPESDEEWTDFIRSFEENGEDVHAYLQSELERNKGRLLTVLPEEFHSFIEDGSINQPYLPKEVRERLLMWSNEMEQNYKTVLEQARLYFESICDQVPENFVKLQEARLHDARILHIAHKDDAIRLTLDGSGSFNNAVCIVLTFKKVKKEHSDLPLEAGQHWLYEEVDVHEVGAVFHVLVDCPMTQWMVAAEDVLIEYYYRANSLPVWRVGESITGASTEELSGVEERLQVALPLAYSELLTEQNGGQLTHSLIGTADAVVDIGWLFGSDQLVRDGEFVWIGQHVALKFSENSEPVVVYRNVGQIAENFEQFLGCCVSTDYIDEYAIFSVPLMDEELEPALLGEDLERMVRAWNTVYQRPEDYVSLIEKGILFLLAQEDENLLNMGSTNASIFEHKGILTELFKEKLKGYMG